VKKTILINSAIFPDNWGDTVSLNKVIKQMGNARKGDDIEVLVNSPGGSVWEGTAIFNYLRDFEPTVRIIGMAGSIASIIALAGKKIIMGPGSMFMVHNPSKLSIGNEHDHRLSADQLKAVKKAMIEAYQTRINKTEAELVEWLDTERYISGKEAKALGLADEFNSEPQEAGKISVLDSTYSFVAMMNSENQPTTEYNNTTINNEVPNMDLQTKVNSLQEELNAKVAENNTLTSKVSDLETQNQKLEGDLTAAKNKVLESKMESYKTEEAAFVDNLIENKQIEATKKDFLVNDLVAKRLEDSGDAYNSMREFLNSKPVNPLTVPQATKDKATGEDGSSFDISDFNSKDKEDQILAVVNKRAQKDGISFLEALELVQSEASAKGGV